MPQAGTAAACPLPARGRTDDDLIELASIPA